MAPNITVHDLIAPLSPRPTLFVHQAVSGYLLLRIPFVDSHQVEARVLDSTRLDSAKSRGETGAGCIHVYGEQEGQVERFVQPVAASRGTYEVGWECGSVVGSAWDAAPCGETLCPLGYSNHNGASLLLLVMYVAFLPSLLLLLEYVLLLLLLLLLVVLLVLLLIRPRVVFFLALLSFFFFFFLDIVPPGHDPDLHNSSIPAQPFSCSIISWNLRRV